MCIRDSLVRYGSSFYFRGAGMTRRLLSSEIHKTGGMRHTVGAKPLRPMPRHWNFASAYPRASARCASHLLGLPTAPSLITLRSWRFSRAAGSALRAVRGGALHRKPDGSAFGKGLFGFHLHRAGKFGHVACAWCRIAPHFGHGTFHSASGRGAPAGGTAFAAPWLLLPRAGCS